jgi:Fe-S-cluster-containing hydrogenase component 2
MNRDAPLNRQFIEQGLYQGQSLLVLDLNKCTRCDECTKACIEQHGTASHGQPLTRLLRDGLRFGDFLVATSCRSCRDAYCLAGCPVDAIHRGKHLQIVIEDHCIGCGLCARNCPYGNIFMMLNTRDLVPVEDPDRPRETRMVAQLKAVTCDLCDAEGREEHPTPRCVYACPHDAAHRMSGEELFTTVHPPGLSTSI